MTPGFSGGSVPAISHSLGSRPHSLPRRVIRFLEAAWKVARERHELAALDERLLKDIGLSRSVADREASREFFDVPEHRIRWR